jgi:histidinol dehydrogenase
MTQISIIDISKKIGRGYLKKILKTRQERAYEVELTVKKIVEDIKNKGDQALFEYSKKFDRISISSKNIKLKNSYIKKQAKLASDSFKKSCQEAAKRIKAFHEKQKACWFTIKTSEGFLSQIIKPLNRVGVYVPGGYTLYPSSVLMNIIPAQIAQVKEIAVATPIKEELSPVIAYAFELLGITEVYQIGGAQAIAALAFGTQSIKQVDKIVGPGNIYVALAKKIVYGTVDIDSIAGPSEVIVWADETANPKWVALDLLAQAEHGSGDEIAICITQNSRFAKKIQEEVIKAINLSPYKNVFSALRNDSICICISSNRKECIDIINECAPEHLEIITKNYKKDVIEIRNAGAIFLGPYSPVAMGDYFIGTNHVLPTGGAARFSSPLGVESFLKRISVAEVTKDGLINSAKHVSVLARTENFIHHALSVEKRAEDILKKN